MTHLIATDKPLLWAAATPDGIYISDIAEVGGKIGIPPSFTAFSDTDENAFLGKVANKAASYNPLPAIGEWVEAGKIYSITGGLVICRQSHFRTAYPLVDTPALFSIYRPAQTGALDWIANENVLVGTERVYNSKTYRCIQAHTTQADWTPDKTPALWTLIVVSTPGIWAVGVAYKVGNVVTYNGVSYKCLQAHTSQAGWTPPVVPALWQKVS